jgi:transposase-like protein
LGVARDGFSRGKQRWRCPSCGKTFIISGMPARRDRQRVWFKRWICEGYSMRQLSIQSGYTHRTLRRIISFWLSRPPKLSLDLTGFKHLVIDGTYFDGRKSSVVGMCDTVFGTMIDGRYGMKEGGCKMYDWCLDLREAGLMPLSVTIDGLQQVETLLRAVWPTVTIQRCLVHVQRQGLAWCRRDPKRAAVVHLRRFFRKVTDITTYQERDEFISNWREWEERFGKAIASRRERGKVFSDVKRARSLLFHALPNMFHYLEDPQIPSDTNWLESYFSRLKSRYRQHRGLSKKNRLNYFSWYFYICRK